MASSASLSCSPPPPGSDPTVARTETRSSAGACRRSSATPIRYSHISTCSAARCSSVCSVSPGITASDHSKKRGHCEPSTPSSSQITCSGNGMDRSCTTSSAAPDWMAEVSSAAFAVTPASISRTIDGLKPGCTIRRYRVCCGGSVCIIVGGVSYVVPISSVRIPRDEQNPPGVGADVRHLRMGRHRPEAPALALDPAHRCRPCAARRTGQRGRRPSTGSDRGGGLHRRLTATTQTISPLGRGSPCASSKGSTPPTSPGRRRPTRRSRPRPGSTARPR